MKKILAVLCTLTCLLGLTACGNETVLSAADESNLQMAKNISVNYVVPYLCNFFDDTTAQEYLEEYNKDEMEYIAESVFFNAISMFTEYGYDTSGIVKIYVDGGGFLGGIASFNTAYETIGDVTEIGEPTAKIAGNQVVVDVPIIGTYKNATAEIVYTNDVFLTMTGATLNVEATKSEAMGKAALNMVMGMGTVFALLIFISLLIGLFGLIPKIQKNYKNRESDVAKTHNEGLTDQAIAHIIEKEEKNDDRELVAVIAAAIAASRGENSTSGFVVRSIRKIKRA